MAVDAWAEQRQLDRVLRGRRLSRSEVFEYFKLCSRD
ncbi:hypothetical protein SLEP1_g2078 [Rubroshorea leprosula]|uniref:Uncharacterized protein n=1 Tax=Rubroshorea leprosula TaxID=152421 RepID=A0AAV5HKE8_9ROSI|nr:hypothetical protein SLEP1_g2078 [Rubroshorea leprosula]